MTDHRIEALARASRNVEEAKANLREQVERLQAVLRETAITPPPREPESEPMALVRDEPLERTR